MLTVEGITAGYGSGPVIEDVSLTVEPGKVVAIVGANGAGKSTTLKVLSGLLSLQRGSLSVDGESLTGKPPTEIVRAGVAHVPEGRQVFANQTVRDNLQLGAYSRLRTQDGRSYADQLDWVLGIFPDLKPRFKHFAGALSGGQQQMLAIGRGLMSRPKYLMLDEPSLGLAPQVTETIFSVITELRDQGVGILLVEQNGRLALAIANQAHLLEKGKITMSGTGDELLQDNEIIERYLGMGSELGSAQVKSDLVEALRDALNQ